MQCCAVVVCPSLYITRVECVIAVLHQNLCCNSDGVKAFDTGGEQLYIFDQCLTIFLKLRKDSVIVDYR